MIVINKTKRTIDSYHRKRGEFLRPGSNDVDEASLTTSERALIEALVHHGACEYGKPPPESARIEIPVAEVSPEIELPAEAKPAVPIKPRRARAGRS